MQYLQMGKKLHGDLQKGVYCGDGSEEGEGK
jgi:hypothetical protein